MQYLSKHIGPGKMPAFKLSIQEHVLTCKNVILTSRGTLERIKIYLVHCEHELGHGVGECCPMPFYSPEYNENLRDELQKACDMVEAKGGLEATDFAKQSSIRFALEGALISSVKDPLWNNAYTRGEEGIPLHHLIWMGSTNGMRAQITQGINAGYSCIKMKVSAETWEQDLQLMREARELNPLVEIRVDANGSFTIEEAPQRLQELSEIGISCIEQPLPPHHWEAMSQLIANSPIRIALDEELLDCTNFEKREIMLRNIRPHAIVIKPSLHGGLQAAAEYLKIAKELKIDCWINSSLESNIGLDLLAQWVGEYMPHKIHGLGTGQLYKENFNTPTRFINKELRYI